MARHPLGGQVLRPAGTVHTDVCLRGLHVKEPQGYQGTRGETLVPSTRSSSAGTT